MDDEPCIICGGAVMETYTQRVCLTCGQQEEECDCESAERLDEAGE